MRNLQHIKEKLSKTPREIVTELAGVSNAYLTELLNETKKANTTKAKIALRIANDVAGELEELEKRIREKYKALSEINDLVEA